MFHLSNCDPQPFQSCLELYSIVSDLEGRWSRGGEILSNTNILQSTHRAICNFAYQLDYIWPLQWRSHKMPMWFIAPLLWHITFNNCTLYIKMIQPVLWMNKKARYYIWAFNCVQDVRCTCCYKSYVWHICFSSCLQTLCNKAMYDWYRCCPVWMVTW